MCTPRGRSQSRRLTAAGGGGSVVAVVRQGGSFAAADWWIPLVERGAGTPSSSAGRGAARSTLGQSPEGRTGMIVSQGSAAVVEGGGDSGLLVKTTA
jgi:hypothetical protein